MSLSKSPKPFGPEPPPPPGVLFVFDTWHEDECGLPGCHRTLIRDFCIRKEKSGEILKVYSTILDVEVSESQIADAAAMGVTLITAERNERVDPKEDPVKPIWLLYHKGYYPHLAKLKNVLYVVGYAPKTGDAAADIREKIFPHAKLYLINHKLPDDPYLLAISDEERRALEDKMLRLATEADVVISIGPSMYGFFENAYRAVLEKDISHVQLLPKPPQKFVNKRDIKIQDRISQHVIFTYGEISTVEAIRNFGTVAASVGSVGNTFVSLKAKPPKWKLQGVSPDITEKMIAELVGRMQCGHIKPTVYHGCSAKALLRSLYQCHLCLLTACHHDYSFEGLEAIATGIPVIAAGDSQLGEFIDKCFGDYVDNCLVGDSEEELAKKIASILRDTKPAFERAKELKENLMENADITKSYGTFAALFTQQQQQQVQNGHPTDSNPILQVQVELDDSKLEQCLMEIGQQEDPINITPEQVRATWGSCQEAFARNTEHVIIDEESHQTVQSVVQRRCGNVEVDKIQKGSLDIRIVLPLLVNLYMLQGCCRSGSLGRAFNSLLITDDMKEEASKVGLSLQLKSTYNPVNFDEVEKFFVNRDGGGLRPVDLPDYTAEDDLEEELAIVDIEEEEEEGNASMEYGIIEAGTVEGKRPCDINGTETSKKPRMEEGTTGEERTHLQKATQTSDVRGLEDEASVKERERLQEQNAQLKSDNEVLKSAVANLRAKLTERESEVAMLKEKLVSSETLQRTITSLKEQIQLKDGQIELGRQAIERARELEAEYSVSKSKLKDHLSEIAELKLTIESKERQGKVVFEEMMKLKERKVKTEQLEEENTKLKTGMDSLKADIQELEKHNKDMQKVIDNLQEELARRASETLDKDGSIKWPVCTLGKEESGSEPGLFNWPEGVLWNGDELVVCDTDNNRVQILTKEYKCRLCLTCDDKFPKPFLPWDIAVTNDNVYYVSDIANYQIVVLSEVNEIVRTFGREENIIPYGVTMANGGLVVTDIKGHRLLKYTLDGQCIGEAGGQGIEEGKLNKPYSVVVNSKNQIITSDFYNHRVQVFDSDLKYLYHFGTKGSGEGQLQWPVGLDVDASDNIYVSDRENHRVVKFKPDGQFDSILFKGDIKDPRYIAVKRQGQNIIVLSQWNKHQLKIFSK